MSKEDDSFLEAKARRKKGAQGKSAEDKVQDELALLRLSNITFDFDRLLDSRAAGRVVAPTVADFTFCYKGRAGALEVKSMKDGHRLAYSKFPQYPRMLRRAGAGGLCLVVVYIEDVKQWRIANVLDLELITKGSWSTSEWDFNSKFEQLFLERLL